MTISVTCTACGVKLKVPDHLTGKKIQCKACQHIFRVEVSAPDVPSAAASQPSATKPQQPTVATPSTSAAAPGPSEISSSDRRPEVATARSHSQRTSTRSRTAATAVTKSERKPDRENSEGAENPSPLKALPLWKRVILHASRNVWSAALLFYVVLWVPLICLFPYETLRVEGLFGLLFFLGIIIGLIMAMIGVSMRNPFEVFTMLTIGTLASLIVPPEHASAAGRMMGKAAGKTGNKPFGETDTGVGGTIAVYCSIGLGSLIIAFGLRILVAAVIGGLRARMG
jgi:hypothetical protein